MTARSEQLAEAVRAELQTAFDASELTPVPEAGQLTAEWSPIREDSDLAQLTIICFPFTRGLKIDARASLEKKHDVGIFVAMAAGAGQTHSALATLLTPLVEAIGERLIGKTLSEATVMEIEHEPLVDHERLRRQRTFEAIIVVSFLEHGTLG